MACSSLVANPVPVEDLLTSAPCRRALDLFSLDEQPIQVFVATVGKDPSVTPLLVCKSDTIACVKLRIQADQGFCVDQQRLVHAGKELTRDECPLQDYGIQHGDVVHLVPLISRLVSLTLRTAHGKSIVFKVWQAEDSQDLHRFISETDVLLPLDSPVVILKGEQVEDSAAAEELALKGHSVLFLRVHKPNIRFRTSRGEELAVASAEDVPFSCSDADITSSGVERLLYLKDVAQFFSRERTEEQYLSYDLQHPAQLLLPSKYSLSFDLPYFVQELFDRVKMGLNAGQVPELTAEGSGGVYIMKDEYGLENVAVFKPMDEEPMAANNPRGFCRWQNGEGLRKGTRSGEGAIREVAAFVLDHPAYGARRTKEDIAKREGHGFAGVPPTTLVRCYHGTFQYGSSVHKVPEAKTGSLQQFVPAISSCEDMGSSMFPVDEVHKISVLDLRMANTDRNGGNILVCQGEDKSIKLVPIDHGYCLPDKFEDCSFEWLYWPQAQQPFAPSTLEYIKSLDADEDILLLKRCGWRMRPQIARNFRISTMVLQKGAAAGLTPFEIGLIMSRNGCLDIKSAIEVIVETVEAMNVGDHAFLRAVGKLLDEHITSLKQ